MVIALVWGFPLTPRQGEVVLLQVNDAAMAGEVFQRALELARLARPQAELQHQLAKPKRLARLALKNLENLLRQWKFTHGEVAGSLYHAGNTEPFSDRIIESLGH